MFRDLFGNDFSREFSFSLRFFRLRLFSGNFFRDGSDRLKLSGLVDNDARSTVPCQPPADIDAQSTVSG